MPDNKWRNIVPDFVDFMASSGDEDLVSPDMLKYLALNHFFTAPASTKYHGNYEGGLFDHSFAVAEFLVQLTEDNHLTWKNPRSPYIVGMFHDLCKIDQYIPQYEMREELEQSPLNDPKLMVLYTLHVHLGFGKKRLREFYDAFSAEHDRLIQYYQMPDDYTWLCKEMLKRIGVDVEAWNRERRESNEAEKH